MSKEIPKIDLKPGDKFLSKEDGQSKSFLIAKRSNQDYFILVNENEGKIVNESNHIFDLLESLFKRGATYISKDEVKEKNHSDIRSKFEYLLEKSAPQIEGYKLRDTGESANICKILANGHAKLSFEFDLILENRSNK